MIADIYIIILMIYILFAGFPDFIIIQFFIELILLLKSVMFEKKPIFVHDNFYQGFIYFRNPLIIIIEDCFMFNLYKELHFSIIVCFVPMIYF